MGAPAEARVRGAVGRAAGHRDSARASAGGDARPAHGRRRGARPRWRRGRGGRDRPGRQVHVPEGAEVEVVETDRGGKSTFHGPGQLVCYPILDLNRHGRDVKRYCRDLEEAVIRTAGAFGVEASRIEGLTGVWLESPPRKLCSIGVHISRWVTTHGYALNVDLDPAPFTDWITACGLEDAAFTTLARELGREVTVDEVRPQAAAALAEVFGLELSELPAEDGAGLWEQPVHTALSTR